MYCITRKAALTPRHSVSIMLKHFRKILSVCIHSKASFSCSQLPQCDKCCLVSSQLQKLLNPFRRNHHFLASCTSNSKKHGNLKLHCSWTDSSYSNVLHGSMQHQHYTTFDTFEGQPPSWLFVSNSVGGAYGAQVNLNFDLEYILSEKNLDELKKNLELRGIQFDIQDLVTNYKDMSTLENRHEELTKLLKEIGQEFRNLCQSEKGENLASLQELKHKRNETKHEMKNTLKSLWDSEESLMLKTLKLPNDLHHLTPLHEPRIVMKVENETDVPSTLNHVEIGQKYDVIKFSNVGPKAYYLKGQLAMAEQIVCDATCQHFLEQNFRLMSGPEFFKTPILEGCGQDVFDTQKVLTLQHQTHDIIEPLNHLAGISPLTFAAYVAKLSIGDVHLPLRMFSIGRKYEQKSLPGLFGAAQSTQVGLFTCSSENDLEEEFESMVQIIWSYLKLSGFTLRMLHSSAKDLQRGERRRTEIQIFAPSLKQYVPIANISDLGDFVSRRLMTIHGQNHADIRHGKRVHMVSGTVLDVTTLLAVWMEYTDTTQESFSLANIGMFSPHL